MTYYYVYVLRSEKDKHFYVGYTANLQSRLKEHNAGRVPSTANRMPLELVYWEGCLNQQDATRREKYLKTAWGKRYIKTRLKNYLTGRVAMAVGLSARASVGQSEDRRARAAPR